MNKMKRIILPLILICIAGLPIKLLSQETMTLNEPVPPNVLILIETSTSMRSGFGDKTRLRATIDSVSELLENNIEANFCLAETDWGEGWNPLEPCGTSNEEIIDTLQNLTDPPTGHAPLAESLKDAIDYFSLSTENDDGRLDFDDAPTHYYCQESHVIIIADGEGTWDTTEYTGITDYPLDTDITCITGGSDNCHLDNVAGYAYNTDLRPDLTQTQNIVTHVIALDSNPSLLQNAAEVGGGIYQSVEYEEDIVGALWSIMNDILEGTYARSAPTISVEGDTLLFGFYEIKPDRPLYYGHLRAYEVDNDPTSETYGEVIYESRGCTASWKCPDGSMWDAGNILASREVETGEYNENDLDGLGTRDIYTNIDGDSIFDSFDASNLRELTDLMLLDDLDAEELPVYSQYDINDDKIVDEEDGQLLIDFVRGWPLAYFSDGSPRGNWKLGDIFHSRSVIATAEEDVFTYDPTFREYLDSLKNYEDTVYVTANDGMIHCFSLDTGDEKWAYIPSVLLGPNAVSDPNLQESTLIDMVSGQTFMIDSTPRLEHVWLDDNNDGEKEADEWHRILVVGQGLGGKYYIALEVTDPNDPYLLWEDTNFTDPVAMGKSMSVPAIGKIYDAAEQEMRYVAFWGGGEGDDDEIEARLYITDIKDPDRYADEGMYVEIPGTRDVDRDGFTEGGDFAASPSALDYDGDGDIDWVYIGNSKGLVYKLILNSRNIDESEICLFFDPYDAAGIDRQPIYYGATAAFTADGDTLVYFGTGSPFDIFSEEPGYLFVVKDSLSCNEGRLYTECDTNGIYELEVGEKITAEPIVYAGVVYFTTFVPGDDRCEYGSGRLYGLDYRTCEGKIDSNADGTINEEDEPYMDLGEGIPSAIEIANDRIYVATNRSSDGTAGTISTVDLTLDPFKGVTAIAFRESY